MWALGPGPGYSHCFQVTPGGECCHNSLSPPFPSCWIQRGEEKEEMCEQQQHSRPKKLTAHIELRQESMLTRHWAQSSLHRHGTARGQALLPTCPMPGSATDHHRCIFWSRTSKRNFMACEKFVLQIHIGLRLLNPSSPKVCFMDLMKSIKLFWYFCLRVLICSLW